MSEAFSLKHVKKAYRNFTLDVKDLTMERGYVLGLLGRNGAGKSTPIKILMNLVYPDQGDVQVLGFRQPEHEIEIKRHVGYVSEEPAFYDEMTVEWMARLVSRYYPSWNPALYQGYLRKFKLDPRKKVKELSRGMKIKLGLLLALSHKPELLILDEPTSGIGPVVRHELLQEITDVIKDEERSVIFSSHITQDVEQAADYVAIMDQGKVIEFADKESLLDRWKKVFGMLPSQGRQWPEHLGEPSKLARLKKALEKGNAESTTVGSSPGAAGEALKDAGEGDSYCNYYDLSSMFVEVKREGSAFIGITDSYSDDWLNRLKSIGATDLRVTKVGLDDVLVSPVGKEV